MSLLSRNPAAHQNAEAMEAPAVQLSYPSDNWSLPPVLLQYWQAIVRRRLMIGCIVAVALAVAVVATLLMHPLYTARSQVEISREHKNVTNVPGLEGVVSSNDLEFYETQYALLKADSLAERIARKLKLAENDAFFEAHGTTPPEARQLRDGKPLLTPVERKRREEAAAQVLLRNVVIEPVRRSRLVNINYTSRSPAWASTIANAWPQEFMGATMDRQFASTADARQFLQERLNNLRTRLEQSEREAANYASDKDIVTLGTTRDASGRTMDPRTLAASDLEALNAALVVARTERIAAEARARSGGAENSDEALASGTLQNLRTKRAEAAGERARLLVQFEPDYPQVRALKEQIDALDAAIARETARISGSRKLSYEEAVARERELESKVAQLKSRLDQQQRDTIQYNIYQREADTNRQLYDSLLQRYKEIGVAGSVGATNIVVVDPAKPPRVPSAPSLPKNLAIALLLGLVIAAGAVFALEQIDEGIRNPGEVEQLLKLPLLGNVPLTDRTPETELDDAKSAIAEAYFSVHTALGFATSHGLPKSLAVTSSQASEGKSTTAFAIARTIGRTGKSVLLIDADMRSPSVHKLIDIPNATGLSNLLAGDDNLAGRIFESSFKGLSIMPAGPIPPSPAELLSTDRMSGLIENLHQRFDHIVIDTPPVLGLADAPLLCRMVEGCLFVIEAERTSVRVIRHALHRLQISQAHPYGVVVTKVDYARHSYGYGYGYGYGHNYGYGAVRNEATNAS